MDSGSEFFMQPKLSRSNTPFLILWEIQKDISFLWRFTDKMSPVMSGLEACWMTED